MRTNTSGLSFRAIFNWRLLVQFFLGMSSGLPLLLATGGTLQAWMTNANVDLKTIGLFAFVGLPYTLKFLWSPILDRFIPPFLDRRRGWIVVTQLATGLALAGLGLCNPAESTFIFAVMAVICAFCSATQDIVVDAYRREVLRDEELGLGSSFYVNGYRVAMAIAGALALMMADHIPWSTVYLIMGCFMGGMVLVTLLAPSVPNVAGAPRNFKDAVVLPFKEYFSAKDAWWMLAFILLYKMGDNMASSMTMPLYLSHGFTKTEVAVVAKGVGLAATLAGGFLGGVLILRLKMNRSLWLFGFFQAISTIGFTLIELLPKSNAVLSGVICFENITAGMGTAAFTGFMASLTDKRFTATQYALLTSLMGVPRVVASAPTGYMVEQMGFTAFFVFCTLIAIPGMLLLHRFAPWQQNFQSSAQSQE
ncbi:MAG: AmpG family muropeptide MFS transporter [Bdellovibrionales bacterium GWA2_49_15]|nr:MAG: AmpG family muropeptide MFS transporter [Bdellovibrionales bacterium GWA2_49_15]